MRSIRFKITALTIAAILTTIVVVFAASFSTTRAETDRRSSEMLELVNQNDASTLELYIRSIEQAVEMTGSIAYDTLDSVMLVENDAAGSLHGAQTAEQAAAVAEYLSGYCENVMEVFSSVAARAPGAVTYYFCINPEVSVAEHGFFWSRVGKTGFAEREPLDARTLDPEDIEHTTWYYTPIQRGRPSWVGPYTAHFLDEMWICSYLIPIYKADTLIGVLGMDIPVDTLVEQTRDIRVYDTGYACLFDADGRVIYHPVLPIGSEPDELGLSVRGEILKQGSSGGELLRYRGTDGIERQMAFSTLSNGMTLAVTAPTWEINASWQRLLAIVIWTAAGVIAVFALLVSLAVGLITRPLVRLTAASQRLAAADYDVELDYRSRDEVGALTNAFTQMRDRIRLYIGDLDRQANTDMLTGLPNMRRFFGLAEATRNWLREEGKKPVILYFDIVGMKHFNSQYGFEEGDRLICDIGHILAGFFGEQNLCRFSEDRFTAITEEAGLEASLEEIFRACKGANGGRSLPIHVGVCPDALEPMSISVACDRAKYACDLHRGTFLSAYYCFDRDMLEQIDRVRYVISHLDRALAERWIQVWYQPIVRTVGGKVCDEEALSRWVDPEKGTFSPADFIPILENARLIWQLDLYVLEQVLEKLKTMERDGLQMVPQSVNLSRADFDSCDIVEEFRSRVDAAGVDRGLISVEITESMVGSDFDFMKRQVERFQELGFRVWMDDFGSGYSALDVLQDIHFDLLKFDMRFMQRFGEGEESRLILTELVRMASGLGVDTVCEGVETREQVDFLREIGCTKLQGYYFSKPLPFDTILERYSREGVPQIGFEDPAETDYYAAIGRVDIFSMAVAAAEVGDGVSSIFNALPVGILEFREDAISFARSNQPYRDFMARFFRVKVPADPEDTIPQSRFVSSFMSRVRQCVAEKGRSFFSEQIPGVVTIHSFIKYIGTNPVNGNEAAAIMVLSVSEEEKK